MKIFRTIIIKRQELTFKGEKSFCIYCNNNASENETKVIKQLAPKSMTYKHKNFYTKEKKNNFFFILILDLRQQFFLNIFLNFPYFF